MSKIQIKDQVTPKTILGLWGFTVSFAITNGLISTEWQNVWTIYLALFTISCLFAIFGIDKPGLFNNAVRILAIIGDEDYTISQRIALIRELLHKITGLWVDLSELKTVAEKESNEQPPKPTL